MLKIEQRHRDAAETLRNAQAARIMAALKDATTAEMLGEHEGDAALDIQAFARFEASLSGGWEDGPSFTAKVGIRRQVAKIDSVSELLRLINGGAQLLDVALTAPPASAETGK